MLHSCAPQTLGKNMFEFLPELEKELKIGAGICDLTSYALLRWSKIVSCLL